MRETLHEAALARRIPVDECARLRGQCRAFADEIVAEARRLAPKARIILYADLLARARLAKAA